MYRKVIRLAIPNIISNITVPLLGLVDTAIVGHLGSPSYIGAIAIGGMIFSMIYWNFGFLRMGTSGFTAQAYGRRDFDEVTRILIRASVVALGIALTLLLIHYPLGRLVVNLLDSSHDVKQYALDYFFVAVWGAPAVLGLYAFKGWYIGMQNARFPMYIAIAVNCINIVCSLFFVYVLDMKVEGVALGTVIAQYSGLGMAILLWQKYYSRFRHRVTIGESVSLLAMKRFFIVNRDIFMRTLCLVIVTTFFTSTGATHGDTVLAVNTLLMQLFTLFSYIMDGFAYAGEALTGRYIGSRNRPLLVSAVRSIFVCGVVMALFFTLLYIIGGPSFLHLLTNNEQVISVSADYFLWVMAIPLCGFAAFLWDGIYVGATASKRMSHAMYFALILFFVFYFLLRNSYANHALWISFLVYLSMRGIMLTYWAKRDVFRLAE